MSASVVPAIGAIAAPDAFQSATGAAAFVRPSGPTSFSQMLLNGVDNVNQKLNAADQAATSFVLDDSVPLHQVTFALEQARLSLELMMQVRSRLVEGYQELSRMQL